MSELLELWDLPDLEAAEADAASEKARALRIGAALFSSMPLEELLHRLERFRQVSRLEVADDRVYDRDMPGVERRFRGAFPRATFGRFVDGVLSGKHGR